VACGGESDSGVEADVAIMRYADNVPQQLSLQLYPDENRTLVQARRLTAGGAECQMDPAPCEWTSWVTHHTAMEDGDADVLRAAASEIDGIRLVATEEPPSAFPYYRLVGTYGSRGFFRASSSNPEDVNAAIVDFEKLLTRYADNGTFRESGLVSN